MTTRLVLAYSGGRQSAAALRWLTERHQAEVVALVVDLGQPDDLAAAREAALAAGAVRGHVIDAHEALMREAVLPSVRAAALSDGRYPMATGLGRIVVARQLHEIARIEGATTVAHGGVGRDVPRMAALVRALDPALAVVACAAEHGLSGAELAAYAGVAGEPTARVDQNLWGRTIGRTGGDPATELPEDLFVRTNPLAKCPDQPAVVSISFSKGAPVGLNGLPMRLAEITDSLSTIAAEHGVGRLDRVKLRADGRRSRVAYEAPAAVVLHRAHHELFRFVSPAPVVAFARSTAAAYADLIGAGEWFSPLRHALDGFVDRINDPMTGTIRLRLFKGAAEVVGRSVEPL